MAVHLYGVTAADTAQPDDLTGRSGAPLRHVADDELAVIVSDVDADAPAGSRDLLAHARVLEGYVAQGTVIPMQFGIAVPSDDMVREQVLENERAGLLELLEFFDGLVQVTVHAVYDEQPALREVLRRDPDLLALRDKARSGPASRQQERQVQLGEAVSAGLQRLADEDATMMLDRLEPLAQAMAENEVAGPQEVLNAAFLVEREGRHEFDAAVGDLRELAGDRIRLKYVGPQPPYSFLEAARTGQLAWD